MTILPRGSSAAALVALGSAAAASGQDVTVVRSKSKWSARASASHRHRDGACRYRSSAATRSKGAACTTAEELLARVCANVNALARRAQHRQRCRCPGFSGASLRGLGSATTLVLLNGRRLANYAFSSAADIGVDLHSIPLAAVERVEILKDGASAIYGSDAIARRHQLRAAQRLPAASRLRLYGGVSRGRRRLADTARAVARLQAIPTKTATTSLPSSTTRRTASCAASRARFLRQRAIAPQDGLDRTSSIDPSRAISSIGNRQYANPAAPTCTDFTRLLARRLLLRLPAPDRRPPAPSEQTSVLRRGTLRLGA